MTTTKRRLCTLAHVAKIESRNDESGTPETISGLGVVYYDGTPETEYRILDDLVERIAPGAFDEWLASRNSDCLCTFNHDDSQLLGRRSSGTARFATGPRGVRFDYDYDETDPDHLRVRAKLARRDVRGASALFVVDAETWERDGDFVVRTLTRCRAIEMGPVTIPAYYATTAGITGDTEYRSASTFNSGKMYS